MIYFIGIHAYNYNKGNYYCGMDVWYTEIVNIVKIKNLNVLSSKHIFEKIHCQSNKFK